MIAFFRVQRNPDGSLPHVGLGSPARSMYPDGNTLDEHRALTVEDIHAAQQVADAQQWVDDNVPRPPIRVTATVGKRIDEIRPSHARG